MKLEHDHQVNKLLSVGLCNNISDFNPNVTKRAAGRVCSINFEPLDNDLCSACHDHPLFIGAWII